MFWSHCGTQLVSNLERIIHGVHKKTQRQMAINHKKVQDTHTWQKVYKRTDTKRWAIEQELKIRREDAGVAKIHFPKLPKMLQESILKKYLYLKNAIVMSVILF